MKQATSYCSCSSAIVAVIISYALYIDSIFSGEYTFYALYTHVCMVSYLYPACALNTLRYFRWQDAFSFLQYIFSYIVVIIKSRVLW